VLPYVSHRSPTHTTRQACNGCRVARVEAESEGGQRVRVEDRVSKGPRGSDAHAHEDMAHQHTHMNANAASDS
jgi:hypothetical protein